KREDQTHHTGHAWHQRAGVEQLDQDGKETDGHQQVRNVRIENSLSDKLHRVRVEGPDLDPGDVDIHHAGRGRNGATLYFGEQRAQIRRDEVHYVLRRGLVSSQRHTLPDRILDPRIIPATLAGDTRGVGRSIVGDLFAQVARDVLATALDWMGRTDIGARRHGQHIGGFGDEHAGRGGAGTRWGNVRHRRHRAV